MQRFEHRQIGRRADRAGIGRKAEQDDGRPCFSAACAAAQLDQPRDLFAPALSIRSGQGAIARRGDAGRQRCRRSRRSLAAPWRPPNTVGLVAPSISGRATSIVVSTGPRPCGDRRPLAQRLEFQRVRGDVGHVERAPGPRLGGGAVVVGRAADKAEPGQRDHRVDRRAVRSLEDTRRSRGARRARRQRPGRRAGPAPRTRGSRAS